MEFIFLFVFMKRVIYGLFIDIKKVIIYCIYIIKFVFRNYFYCIMNMDCFIYKL